MRSANLAGQPPIPQTKPLPASEPPAVILFPGITPKGEATSELLRSEALNKIAQDPRLPSPPALALEIVKKANDPNCVVEEVGELVKMDSALCAKLLKTINSALFSLPRPVTSIDLALNLMGIKQFRSLVLGLSLPAMQSGSTSAQHRRSYWKSSVAGAIIARELALRLRRPEPEDDLVTGLLRDIGEMILERLFPETYADVMGSPPDLLATSQCWLEERLFHLNHADLSAFMLKRWGLPDDITEPVRYHHQPGLAIHAGPQAASRARIIHFATRAAQLLLTPGQAILGGEIVDLAQTQFRMNEPVLRDFLQPLQTKIEQFAGLLNVEIGRCESYYGLVTKALEELEKKTVEDSIDPARTPEEQAHADHEADRWRLTACRLRKDSVRDPLTDAFHRGYFDQLLAAEFKRARRQGNLIGLLLVDLDDFRQLNRKAGSPWGNVALQEIARKLRRTVQGDHFLARYAGDEFAVLFPQITAEELKERAEQACQTVAGLALGLDKGQSLTASVGGALAYPAGHRFHSSHFLGAAEVALGQAKEAGKNQVRVTSLLSPEEVRLLQEVERRLFSTHLDGRGVVAKAEIVATASEASHRHTGFGRLARNLGWINSRKLRRLLQEIEHFQQPWNEVALERGYLTQTQIWALRALQREYPETLVAALVGKKVVTEKQGQQELAEYYQKLRGGS
jgi:diguanylate cyclase (GGDEF)-like protein